MRPDSSGLKWLFAGFLGLAAGAAFCMKWMEPGFQSRGELFTIIGLEISYTAPQIREILESLDPVVREKLRLHLYFDFAFMAGVYPAIATACIWVGRSRQSAAWRKMLVILSAGQVLAAGADVAENRILLGWLDNPAGVSGLEAFHQVVWLKWGLAVGAILLTVMALFFKKREQTVRD